MWWKHDRDFEEEAENHIRLLAELDPSGKLALRLPPDERERFLKKYGACISALVSLGMVGCSHQSCRR